ncbi:MAG: hypothetical protein WAL12_06610, partial [Trebonia sp.]
DCGNPGTALTDAGTGLVGWRHLSPICDRCSVGRRALRLAEFAALLDGRVQVETPSGISGTGAPDIPVMPVTPEAGESPYAVLSAEIALLHARLDDLQSRLDR